MRIVLDVNVLVSAFFGGTSSAPRIVFDICAHREASLVISDGMLNKLDEVLGRPKFSNRLSSSERKAYVERVRLLAILRPEPDSTVRGVAEDAEDDAVLGTAVAGNVRYLVTGDKWLLEINEHRGVRIVTPRDFLAILAAESRSHTESG